jgi:hypothetical protein
MTTLHNLFGLTVVATHASHPAAIGQAYDVGKGRIVRQPASMKAFFDRLASGEPLPLKGEELAFLDRIGVETLDVTMEVRERDAFKALNEGVSPAIINARDTAKHFRTASPIKVVAGFKPI